MNWNKRLTRARVAKGFNKRKLASLVGVSAAAVTQWENGDTKTMESQNSLKVCKVLGVNMEWLIRGQGPMRDGWGVMSDDGQKLYPVITWEQAGVWNDRHESFRQCDASAWLECAVNLGKFGYVLRVEGPSMAAGADAPYSFAEGVMLYVSPEEAVMPEKFVVVRRGKHPATFKKYVMLDGMPFLETLNPTWPKRYLKLEKQDRFCGVVMYAGMILP